MRIAWASPMTVRSAIGRVSADVVQVMVARGHRVRIIATELEGLDEPTHPVAAEILHWRDPRAAEVLADSDVLIINVGDNYLFHAGLFALLDRVPTVGVFHDFYLYNLFSGWLWDSGRRGETERLSEHARVILEVYGPPAVAPGAAAQRGDLTLSEIARQLPMTEWIGARCQGALAHAGFYRDRLLASCPGPVELAAMPVTGRAAPPLVRRTRPKVALLTVGVMNPNKCADRVIAALAASPALAGAVDYRLVGPIEPAEETRLWTLAEQLGYRGLSIHGAVSDDELADHLADADIISCLRNPILEGASGSAIEGLLAGRPVIVADAGFYADLPDDLVFKVPADIPEAELVLQLERLVGDEPLRRRTGAQARAWAERRFNLPDYADALEALAAETIQAEPALSVGRQIGQDFQRLGLSRDDPAIARVSQTLAAIFPSA